MNCALTWGPFLLVADHLMGPLGRWKLIGQEGKCPVSELYPMQVSDEPGAAEAPPEVREPELPGVHASEAVCAEAAHGDATAAAGSHGAQGGGSSRLQPPHDAGAACAHAQQFSLVTITYWWNLLISPCLWSGKIIFGGLGRRSSELYYVLLGCKAMLFGL